MGFLTRLLNSGNHAIQADQTLDPTRADAITPSRPGSLETIQTVPTLPRPRYFGEAEARALSQMAEQRQQDLQHSKVAYESLQDLENADTQIHLLHRNYQTTAANGELKRKQADTKYSQHLHAQRPAYADLTSGLGMTVEAMDARVKEIVQRVGRFF